jgi:molybdate transport system regulatory protein
MAMCPLSYQFKLWMINEKNEAVFGDGLARLLEEINRQHSVLEAAKNLGMSYRYALHRITLAEERLDQSLVNRVRGGAKGGGSSEVTTFGKKMIEEFRKMQSKVDKAASKALSQT